jgi:hypothetical protein
MSLRNSKSAQNNPKLKPLSLPTVSEVPAPVLEAVENVINETTTEVAAANTLTFHVDEDSSDSSSEPVAEESGTGKQTHVRVKKHRRVPYVSPRTLPATCQKIFSTQSGGAVQLRPPYQSASNIKLITTRAFHHFPYQTLLEEMHKSQDGTSADHVFDLAQQVRINAETVFRFTTPNGSGLIPQATLNDYIRYCEECEYEALQQMKA